MSVAPTVRTLAWRDVDFTVNKGTDSETMILKGVSGEFSGMCAIMGPSGAGKSSLLNVLAGRSATNGGVEVKAEVTIDGARIICSPQETIVLLRYPVLSPACLSGRLSFMKLSRR